MIAATLFVLVLLLIGVVLRLGVGVFRWLYIPASVIAGLVGLLVVQSSHAIRQAAAPIPPPGNTGEDTSTLIAIDSALQSWSDLLSDWPSFLIAVVFAGMLLERKPVQLRDGLSQVGRQGLMVWIIVVGQSAIGLLVTWLMIKPFYDVPNSVGLLIETGFAGGHGTAAAMGKVYASPLIGFPSGFDLGILMATCGLVYGVVSGILWINLAIRWGWIESPDHHSPLQSTDQETKSPIGQAKIGSETIDPLLLQAIWLALAVAVGIALQQAVAWGAGLIDTAIAAETPAGEDRQVLREKLSASTVLGFPLFIYTLFGGWIVRTTLKFAGRESVVDRATVNRLTSSAMDVLVVAAITSLNLAAVISLLVPFLVLFVAGAIWSGVCLLILARWILPPRYWFQLGLINYGMSTGTTATGFVLLRVVDPELESGAAEDYALAAPLSSPFIGGGILTVALPLLVLERIPIGISAITAALLVAGMIAIGIRWNRRYRSNSAVTIQDSDPSQPGGA